MKILSLLFNLLALLSVVVLGLLLYGKINTALLLLLGAAVFLGFCLCRPHVGHDHGAFLSIDYYAAHSPLTACSPLLKIVVALAGIIACLLGNSVSLYLFVCVAMFACVVFWGKVPVAYYLSLLLLPASFICLSSLAIAVQILPRPSNYLLDWPVFGFYLGITPQSQNVSLQLAARALSAVSCLYMLSLTTPLPGIMAVLRRLKLPTIAIDLLYLTYRYIFILLKTNEQLWLAATSRLGYRTFKTGFKSAFLCASNLLLLSWREADNNYTAMLARGYGNSIAFWESPPRQSPFSVLAAVIYLILLFSLYVMTR